MLVTQERQRCCAHEGNNRKDQAIVNLTRCKLANLNRITRRLHIHINDQAARHRAPKCAECAGGAEPAPINLVVSVIAVFPSLVDATVSDGVAVFVVWSLHSSYARLTSCLLPAASVLKTTAQLHLRVRAKEASCHQGTRLRIQRT